MREAVSVVMLAVLMAVAGCGGASLGGADASQGRTVNPMLENTPTQTGTATPAAGPPPGVSPKGVNAWAVAQGHREALAGRSRTYTVDRVVTAGDDTLLANTSTRVSVNGTRQLVAFESIDTRAARADARARNLAYWTNGSQTVVRYVSADGTIGYDSYSRYPTFGIETTGWKRVYAALAGLNASLTGQVTRDGRTLYALRAEGPNASLRMLITPGGVVTRFRLQTVDRRDGRTVTEVVRFRLTDVGSTAAARPGWYGTAVATAEGEGAEKGESVTDG